MAQDTNGRPRLDVVAALLSLDQAASTVTGAWTALDGELLTPSDAAMIDWATDEEWELAAALRGARGELSELDAEAVAGLLRIAAATRRGTLLLTGLYWEFIQDDPDDRGAAFAELFERLIIPGLVGSDRHASRSLLRALTATSPLTRL
jgi:hypothetical protein